MNTLRKTGSGILIVSSSFLLLVLLMGAVVLPLGAAGLEIVHAPRCVNVTDTSMSITWSTNEGSDGHVDYGTTSVLGTTESDPATGSPSTHMVTLGGLDPQTQIYYQVRSGSVTDDNGGALYTCTTGPTLALTTPSNNIWGRVYNTDSAGGTIYLPNALVYLRLVDKDGLGSPGKSQLIAARTDANGVWARNLTGIRTSAGAAGTRVDSVSDYDSYFSFTLGVDGFEMWADVGASGSDHPASNFTEDAPRVETIPVENNQQFDVIDPTFLGLVGFGANKSILPAPLLIVGSLAMVITIGIFGRRRPIR